MNLKYLCFTAVFLVGAAIASDRPNIVVIMVDDMGYECIGANGCAEYSTPVVDNLASNGLRFANAHSTPVCTPTRTQIMSGRYGHRNYTRFTRFIESEVCFAELLRDAGYATMMAGKWQLGGYDLDTTLNDFGFDEYAVYNLPGFENASYDAPGSGRFWDADIYTTGEVHIDLADDEYGPDTYTDLICDFIDRKAGAEPFLVYYAMALTHNPFVPTPHSDFTWPPGGAQEIYDSMDDEKWFKDMVEYGDFLVGRILQTLEDAGVADNTVVIFTGDNGTNAKYPVVTTMKDGSEVVGGKNSTKKTGTHVPFIADWPSQTYLNHEIAALYDHSDMLPTLVELAGAELPDDRVIDGISIAPILRGEAVTNERAVVFCEWFGGGRTKSSLRDFALDERWKYFISGEFYDMDTDPEEVSPIAEADMTPEMIAARDKLRNKIESVYSRNDDDFQLASNPNFNDGLSKWRHFGNGWAVSNGMAVVAGTSGDPLDLRWMYQYHPAHPGQYYSAAADILTSGLAAGEAKAWLQIDFFDKDHNILGTAASAEITAQTDPARVIHIDNALCPVDVQYLRLSTMLEPISGGDFDIAFDRMLLKTGKLRNPGAEFQNNAGWVISDRDWTVSNTPENASSGTYGFATTVLGGATNTRTASQTVQAVPGETYTVSADIRAAGSSGNLILFAAYAGGDGVVQNQAENDGSTAATDRPNCGAFASGSAFNGFYFFELSDLMGINVSNLLSVTFSGELAINTASNFNCDAYAYGQNSLGAAGSDYQIPGSATTGTLVQDDYLTPALATDTLYPLTSDELKNLVLSLYNSDGTPASNYLVLRLQPDWDVIPALTSSVRYRINSHKSGLAAPGLQFEIGTGGADGNAALANGDGVVLNQVNSLGEMAATDRPNIGAFKEYKAFNGFYTFELPDLTGADPADVTNVVFSGELSVNTASGFNCDVFAYGTNSLGLSAADYQIPESNNVGTLVQDDYLTPSLATGQIYPINSAALKNLVLSLYNPDGSPASPYLVLRMQPDWLVVPDLASSSRYRINSYRAGQAVPMLILEGLPEGETLEKSSRGTIQAQFLNASGSVLAMHQSIAVTNDQEFVESSITNVAPAGSEFVRVSGVVEVSSAPLGSEFWSFDNFKLNDSALRDLDRDGLADAVEPACGTDTDRADTDADTMPDGWEIDNGLNPTNTADGAAHGDDDQFSNAEEYIAGTDPLDSGSFFAITNMTIVSGEIEIEWVSVEGRTYDVQWSPDLAISFSALEEGIEHPVNSFMHSAGTKAVGFMKVDVNIK